MPCYNEASTVKKIIEKTLEVPLEKELIIVNDGSTDGSKEIINAFQNIQNVIIHHQQKNQGKGAAIRAGINYCSGDIITIQDADLETNPHNFTYLVEPILTKKTKVVYGSRLLNEDIQYSKKYYYGGKLVTKFANILYNQNITDEPTCYKLFDATLLKSINLTCKGFEFCPEVTAKVSKLGHKIIELPMDYYPRTENEGKKLKWTDGVIAIWTLLKFKFIK